MADGCRHLQTLALIYSPWYNDVLQNDGWEEAANAYAAGVVQLLSGMGPRLRELRAVRSASHWTVEAYQALRHCTGLTSLTLEAGWRGTERRSASDLSKSQLTFIRMGNIHFDSGRVYPVCGRGCERVAEDDTH